MAGGAEIRTQSLDRGETEILTQSLDRRGHKYKHNLQIGGGGRNHEHNPYLGRQKY